MSDIERELESELHRILDPLAEEPIPALRVPAHGHTLRTAFGGAGAAVTFKLLTGVAVAAAAAATLTVAGAATTGSVNPVDWGQQVSRHVADCKKDLADGQQHGQGNGNPTGSANAHGNNPNANGNANGKSKSHPVPTPKGNSAGDPTDPSTHPAVTPGPTRP